MFKIWLKSVLLCHPLALTIPINGVLNFMQRVWPFSHFVFTESARTQRRILAQLAASREEFYSRPEVRQAILEMDNYD
jgi:hypothetical protein